MKRKRRAGGKTSAALMRRGGRSSAGRNFQFRADVQFNFIPVVVKCDESIYVLSDEWIRRNAFGNGGETLHIG